MKSKDRSRNQPITELFKPGIIFVVLITGLAGYALSYRVEQDFRLLHILGFLAGLGIISAGSFALNQAQESHIDAKMPRTQGRPIPSGRIARKFAFGIGIWFVILGAGFLWFASPLAMILGVATAGMYNLLYTLYWKKHWTFGAVPGAIPGAMPVMIGYAANSSDIFSAESLYMFLIMFTWQMPHFWALAIRFKDDYQSGGIPVLPLIVGVDRTLYHIGLYVFLYVALALASPWFVETGYLYFVIILPFALKVLHEFLRFHKANGEQRWLPFFLWVNFSVLAFLVVPVVEKWTTFFMSL